MFNGFKMILTVLASLAVAKADDTTVVAEEQTAKAGEVVPAASEEAKKPAKKSA